MKGPTAWAVAGAMSDRLHRERDPLEGVQQPNLRGEVAEPAEWQRV